MSRRPILAVTMGDPAGIGPEITLRLIARARGDARLLVIGDEAALERERAHVPSATPLPHVADPVEMGERDLAVALWSGASACASLPAHGAIDAEAGRASHTWVVQAADLALEGRVQGVVTGPIHKEAWNAAGVGVPGHTEVLRDRAGCERVLMLLVGGSLRVALATIHVPLRSVADRLTTAGLVQDLTLLSAEIARRFGPERPRIAVCGLNPHAGEGGLFGSEDAEVIAPAVALAVASGVDAVGPLPADGCIPSAVQGGFDAVLAMYHDQALPAAKAIAPRRCVNVTLGLPFIRTSVDHGTAFDIAGSGQATADSFDAAVCMAVAMSERATVFAD